MILTLCLFFPTDYEASVTIDSVLEVDDGWMLSGVHQHTLPNIRIVTASMPAAGNYSSFLKAGELRSWIKWFMVRTTVLIQYTMLNVCIHDFFSTLKLVWSVCVSVTHALGSP